jgi:hypothetical protein
MMSCDADSVVRSAAVSAYVTHGVFPKQSWAKFKADNGGECIAHVPACTQVLQLLGPIVPHLPRAAVLPVSVYCHAIGAVFC